MIDLFIVTGESSGDLQGASLVEALLEQSPSLQIQGVAGPRLRALGVGGSARMEELQVMGFIDVLFALPKIFRLFRQIRADILRLQPKAVVCIDYPGFNLRLARSLRKSGYQGKLIHFICPTVWAWGKKRIPLMAQNLDLLLTLFPFEKKCFAHTALPVVHVGHPLVKKIGAHKPLIHFRERYHLNGKKILALFPGSRETEIRRNFPQQKAVAERLLQIDPDLQIVVSLSHPERLTQLKALSEDLPLIEPEHHYDLMRAAHLALAKSGTVTLELALFKIPTVVHFAIKPLDVFLAQKIFKIHLPHYCIVNIVGGKEIFPELFGPNFTEESLYEKAKELLESKEIWERCRTECAKVAALLGSTDASQEAAEQILKKTKEN